MGFDIQQQWNAVKSAPVLYIGAICVVAGIIWLLLSHMKANRIESLEERIRLRDDEIADYKRQLDGASPDEAKARIDALEERLNRHAAVTSPRIVTQAQGEAAIGFLRRCSGSEIMLTRDGTVADAAQLSGALQTIFAAAGWKTGWSMSVGLTLPVGKGLWLRVRDPQRLSPAQSVVKDALQAAGLDFEIQGGPPLGLDGDRIDAEIIIGRPFVI